MATTSSDIDGSLPFGVGDTIFERYRVEQIVGAIGRVWYLRASYLMAPQLGYAVQVLPNSGVPDCPHRRYFLEEAERVSDLPCPPFVPVIRSGEIEKGHAVIVREFLPGRHLRSELPVKAMGPVAAMRVIESVASAMWISHKRERGMHGFTYYDLMINTRPGEDTVGATMLQSPHGFGELCHDFGRLEGDLARYCAPEFLETRHASVSADVYALGMLCAVLLLGEAHEAFLIELENYDFAHLEGFRPVILRAVSKERRDRFECVESFVLAARQAAWSVQAATMDQRSNTFETRVFARRIDGGDER